MKRTKYIGNPGYSVMMGYIVPLWRKHILNMWKGTIYQELQKNDVMNSGLVITHIRNVLQ
jgi:hypothetical protein